RGYDKLEDLALALKVERVLTKRQIMADYLSEITTGLGRRGVTAAACAYCRAPLQGLSIGQYALLAGVTQAPSNYDPTVNPEAARERRARGWAAVRCAVRRASDSAMGSAPAASRQPSAATRAGTLPPPHPAPGTRSRNRPAPRSAAPPAGRTQASCARPASNRSTTRWSNTRPASRRCRSSRPASHPATARGCGNPQRLWSAPARPRPPGPCT